MLAHGYGVPLDELFRQAGYEPGIELSVDEWSLVNIYRGLEAGRQRHLLTVATNLAAGGEVEDPPT